MRSRQRARCVRRFTVRALRELRYLHRQCDSDEKYSRFLGLLLDDYVLLSNSKYTPGYMWLAYSARACREPVAQHRRSIVFLDDLFKPLAWMALANQSGEKTSSVVQRATACVSETRYDSGRRNALVTM
jgi:hypothetical protein